MAREFKDLTGEIIGNLTVVRFAGKNPTNHSMWECKCSCGNMIVRSYTALRDARKRRTKMRCEKCRAKQSPSTGYRSVVAPAMPPRKRRRGQAIKLKGNRSDSRSYVSGKTSLATQMRLLRIGDDLERILDAETLHSPKQSISDRERNFAAQFRRSPRPGF